jgi:hypothetical protein
LKPVLDTAFRIGADLDQRSDDIGMPFGGRPHDRGLPAPRLGDVHIGAIEHELAYRIEIAGAGRDHHGRLAVPSRRARIGARLQQALDDVVVAVGGGERQGRFSVLVDDVHVRAGREQATRAIERSPRCTAHASGVAPSG